MHRLCASVLLLLATGSQARAQKAKPLRLSEADFIAEYQRVEPRLRAYAAEIERAEAQVATARVLMNPRLQYEREAAGTQADTRVGLGVMLDLGGRSARIRSSRARVRATALQARHKRWRLRIDALTDYYLAVRAREFVALFEAGRTPLARTLMVVRAQASAGDVAGYDRDRIELEVLRYDQRLDQARADYRIASLRLGRWLERTGAQAAREMAAEADIELAIEPTIEPTGTLSVERPPSLTTLVAGLGQTRADLRATQTRREAARDAAVAAGRWWIPAVNLAGGVRTVTMADQRQVGYFITANLEIPVFDRNQGAREQAAAAERYARADAAAISKRAATDIRAAHARLTASLERLAEVERTHLPRAARLVERAALLYREETGSVLELADAHRTVLGIRERHLALRFQAKLAELALWRALGERTDGGGHE